jgi:hypothetical protein
MLPFFSGNPMRRSALLLCFSFAFGSAAFAQTPPAATSAVEAVCKDGTSFSGETLKGACRGHGGVDRKANQATASQGASAAAAKATPPMAEAAGGGSDKVWGNDASKVYHCPGDRYYGKTKRGEYMTEADAKAKGFHADHGKACAKG